MAQPLHQPEKSASRDAAVQRQESIAAATPVALPNISNLERVTPDQISYLQRTAGNRAVVQLLRNQARGPVQPKLTVGPVGDQYEQEADRIAAQVTKNSAPVQRADQEESEGQVQRSPLVEQITPLVRRSPLPGLQRDHLGDEEEDQKVRRSPLPTIQRNFPNGGAHAAMPPIMGDEDALQRKAQPNTAANTGGSFEAGNELTSKLAANRGRGQPLSSSIRRSLEPKFGANFAKVRVHTDGGAVQMNRDIQAKAFTHGSDIYFNRGTFNPGSKDGRHLLAHELTHVVQQTGAGVQRKPEDYSQQHTKQQWSKGHKAKTLIR